VNQVIRSQQVQFPFNLVSNRSLPLCHKPVKHHVDRT
jgi:hypothetical protein